MSYAFTLATHDPTTEEKALIAGREFYARRFTIGEVQGVDEEIQKAVQAAIEKGVGYVTVRDEMKAVLRVLNARLADGGKPMTVSEAVAAFTDVEYRALLKHYAPSLLRPEAGAEGNV
jgi:hypothetical protein